MIFKTDKNWKEYLSVDDEEKMNDLLKKIARYRGAYKNAEDIKIAQLWCAVLEIRKENLNLNVRLKRIESMLDSLISRDYKEKETLLESLKQL